MGIQTGTHVMQPLHAAPGLVVMLVLAAAPGQAQVRPPNFSPDFLPETDFTCEDKVTGGYYADVEAECQLFHVCVQVSDYEFQDFHFLCPNDTVFDQQHLVCTNWFEVDCHAQLAFFTNDFGVRSRGGGSREDEDVRPRAEENQAFLGQSHLRNTGRGQVEVGRRRQQQGLKSIADPSSKLNFQFDEQDGGKAGTPIPLGFTTTIRPAGRTTNGGGLLSGRNLRINLHSEDTAEAEEEERSDDEDDDQAATEATPARSFSGFGRDGRKPKVKSNLRAGLANAGGHKRFPATVAKSDKPASTKFATERRRKKVLLTEKSPTANNRFDSSSGHDGDDDLFLGPDVKPDGRMARVKADILAENQNKPELAVAAPSLEPFIEAFFASPSSPKPFVFTGSPRPADQFGSASTFQPFFVPTAKAVSSSIASSFVNNEDEEEDDSEEEAGSDVNPTVEADDDNDDDDDKEEDNEIEAETTTVRQQQAVLQEETSIPRPRNRFLSRPSPAAVTAKQPPTTPVTEAIRPNDSEAEGTAVDVMEDKHPIGGPLFKGSEAAATAVRPTGFRQRQFVKPAVSTTESARKEDDSEAGRRPRVKSNITANKRNFWQKDTSGALGEDAGRKLRRGRKQKTPVDDEVENDIRDEPAAAPKATDGASLLEELMMADKKEMAEGHIRNHHTIQPVLETSTTTTTMAGSDSFKDVFEEEEEEEDDDLIVSSSTVSAVVFKGSPTPSPFGFFSSPQPDWDGPSKASVGGGGFAGSPRPSFSNIGNDIHLGPEKRLPPILPLDQLFFVSSTQSNKIFIGADNEDSGEEEDEDEEDETSDEDEETTTSADLVTTPSLSSTTAAVTAEAGKRPSPFPSFPIRGKLGGGGLAFPFRQLKTGAQKEGDTKVTPEAIVDTTTTTTAAPQETPTTAVKTLTQGVTPGRLSSFGRVNRPASVAFPGRKPLDGILASTTSKPVDLTTAAVHEEDKDTTATALYTEEASTETLTTVKVQPQLPGAAAARFQLKALQLGTNFPSGLPGRSRNFPRKENDKSSMTTTDAAAAEITVVATAASLVETETSPASAEPSVLSVESILTEDDNENELDSDISNDDEDADENVGDNGQEQVGDEKPGESRNFEKKLVSKAPLAGAALLLPSVTKALGPPPNANIRVEFKKASALPADEEGTKKFFVKPDGRKPRVKSNIRATFANRGQQFPFGPVDGSAPQQISKLEDEDLSFHGDPELEHVDNTEKRAISSYQPLEQLVEDDSERLQQKKLAWPEESENEVVLPVFIESQPQHYHNHHHQQQQQESSQLGGIHSTVPGYNQPQTFLEQLITGPREEQASTHAQQLQPSDLSAFHALMAQTVPRTNEFPQLQLLNPRDQLSRGGDSIATSQWPAQQTSEWPSSSADYSSSPQQQQYPPFSSLV